MIKIGTAGIADVKLGTTQIAKVCAGSNVVWQKAPDFTVRWFEEIDIFNPETSGGYDVHNEWMSGYSTWSFVANPQNGSALYNCLISPQNAEDEVFTFIAEKGDEILINVDRFSIEVRQNEQCIKLIYVDTDVFDENGFIFAARPEKSVSAQSFAVGAQLLTDKYSSTIIGDILFPSDAYCINNRPGSIRIKAEGYYEPLIGTHRWEEISTEYYNPGVEKAIEPIRERTSQLRFTRIS